jgi:hypothetical protein
MRQHLPYTVVSGDVVMVPASAAGRADLSTFSVIPADTSVARAATVDTRALGAGPARAETVITEMRNPPGTYVERRERVSPQR